MAAGGGSGNLFTVTYGNMRQYLQDHPLQHPQRQQGSVAGWHRLAPATEGPVATGDGTMPLFPARPDKAPQLSQDLPEAKEKKAPMTILYKGQVHLFEDVPTDKALKLMQLAGTWSASQAPEVGPSSGTVLLKRAADLPLEEVLQMSDLRKASVRRFLSKRQYRNAADVPYERVAEENEAADFKAVNDEPSSWLKL